MALSFFFLHVRNVASIVRVVRSRVIRSEISRTGHTNNRIFHESCRFNYKSFVTPTVSNYIIPEERKILVVFFFFSINFSTAGQEVNDRNDDFSCGTARCYIMPTTTGIVVVILVVGSSCRYDVSVVKTISVRRSSLRGSQDLS